MATHRAVRSTTRCLVTLALAAAIAAPASAIDPLPMQLLQRATGLFGPTAIANAGDGSGRLFIAEQPGTIRIFDGTQLLPADFLDIQTLVESSAGERGLLGLTFHPDYVNNGYFYVHYSREPDGDSTIARYTVSAGDPNDADEATASVLLVVDQDGGAANHNGGDMHFGPDGFLYVAFGDDGGAGDPFGNGQNPATLSGSLIRIDVDNPDVGLQYGIPTDNPFFGQAGAREEIWAYGLRNPWRFSFDRETGDVFIADVGQGQREEVNFQPAASPGGENYGWNCKEGTANYDFQAACALETLIDPVLEYGHVGGLCSGGGSGSVTGGYRYRGSWWSGLRDLYIYADYCTGTIAQAVEGPPGVFTPSLAPVALRGITTFGEDETGEIHLATGAGVLYEVPEPTGPMTALVALATLALLRRSRGPARR